MSSSVPDEREHVLDVFVPLGECHEIPCLLILILI
jgi:hypothetical protein